MSKSAIIIELSPSYSTELKLFLKRVFPSYSSEYIEYDVCEALKNNQGKVESFIVVDDDNKIVGCHLCLPTKALVYGEEKIAFWGHDTYLDKNFRAAIGLDFVLKLTSAKNGFGLGLTPSSRKMHQKLRSSLFVDGIRRYCLIKLRGAFIHLLKLQKSILTEFPDKITISGFNYCLCSSPDQINIPNNGYWNPDCCDVDFIRDKSFLNNRFFKNKVHNYFVYTSPSDYCYFVVRPYLFKRIKALLVVDFRYKMNNPQLALNMFKAAETICTKIHAGALLFTTNDQNIKKIYDSKRLCKSYPIDFIANKKFVRSSTPTIPITAADSDDDLLK